MELSLFQILSGLKKKKKKKSRKGTDNLEHNNILLPATTVSFSLYFSVPN